MFSGTESDSVAGLLAEEIPQTARRRREAARQGRTPHQTGSALARISHHVARRSA